MDFTLKTLTDRQKAVHYQNLKHGRIATRKSSKEEYAFIVSGGCTIAIKTAFFKDGAFDVNTAANSSDGVIFVVNSFDFVLSLNKNSDKFTQQLNRLQSLDFHSVIFQDWDRVYEKKKIQNPSDITYPPVFQRGSVKCACIKHHLGNALLYQL